MREIPFFFRCESDELIGMIHVPEKDECCNVGVLIVVGGPQYRAGSHRQFVTLARDLANAGIPVMRFDYRGMGDSEGEQISFEQTGPDIKAAVNSFILHCPGIERVVLWGLCDAASACLMYSTTDDRIKGMVLANPWVRTEEGSAKAHLKHYYTARFFEKEFWMKIIKLKFNYAESLHSLFAQIKSIFPMFRKQNSQALDDNIPFQKKMEIALSNFYGKTLFIISGNDLTASEFKDLVDTSSNWKKNIKNENVTWCDLENADHTFSRKKWKKEVSDLTIEWIQKHYA